MIKPSTKRQLNDYILKLAEEIAVLKFEVAALERYIDKGNQVIDDMAKR